MGLMSLQEDVSSWWQKGHAWLAEQLNDTKPGGTIASLEGCERWPFYSFSPFISITLVCGSMTAMHFSARFY